MRIFVLFLHTIVVLCHTTGNRDCNPYPQHPGQQDDAFGYILSLSDTPDSTVVSTSYVAGSTYYLRLSPPLNSYFKGFWIWASNSSQGTISTHSASGWDLTTCEVGASAVTHYDSSMKTSYVAKWIAPSSDTATIVAKVVYSYRLFSAITLSLKRSIVTPSNSPKPASPTPSPIPTSTYDFSAPLSSVLTLQWRISGSNLQARLSCSSIGAWASFSLASTPKSMSGLDGILVEPASLSVKQITVGTGHDASAIKVLSTNGARELAGGTLSETAFTATSTGWSATFTRPLAAGNYPGAIAINVSALSIVTVAWGREGESAMAYHRINVATISIGFASGKANPFDASSQHAFLITAHALLMFIAWSVIFPVGAAFARWCKGWKGVSGEKEGLWFPGHVGLQSVGWVLLVAGFACSVAAVASYGGKHFSSLLSVHSQLGLATFLIGLMQPLVPLVRPPPALGRAWFELVHKGAGWISMLFLAPASIFLGLNLYGLSSALTIAYGTTLGATFFAMICCEVRHRKASAKPPIKSSNRNP